MLRDWQSRTVALLLLGATAAAWIGVVRADAAMQMTHGVPSLSVGAAAVFVLQWGLMMTAMMLPAAAPMILLYGTVGKRANGPLERAISPEIFALVYLALWMLTGVPVYIASVATAKLAAASPSFDASVPYVIASTLIIAGLYQLTPAKHACLRACEAPISFLMRRWRAGYGATLKLAATHAAYCIGCCWALMVVLVIAGAMSLPWVLAIALVVFAERVLPAGGRTARIIGLGLIAVGIGVAVRPELADVFASARIH